jgi:signal peptidase II
MPRWALIFIAVLISADQLLKQYMLSLVFEPPRVIEVTGFFNIVPVWNRGVSFGMLGDSGTSRWILVGLAFVIVVMLVVWLFRAGSVVVLFALVLVIGGALSNVIDRVVFGAVVDFMDIHAFGWHWPAFNLADMSIVAGTALLLYDSLFGSPRALK